jgi:signal transduction histidine kinase
MLRRLPIESRQPIVVFGFARLAVTLTALIALAVLGFPYGGRAAVVIVALALPWSLFALWISRRDPDRALSAAMAAGDFVVLIVFELVVPDTWAAVRFGALYLVAAHAAFQGERRGLAVAAAGAGTLVLATVLRGDAPPVGDQYAFYEVAFVLTALATAVVVGGLRTSESASRLRARGLSRRTIQSESEVRRRLAEALHDGPVQELIGLDMILSSARTAAARGRNEEAARLIDDAREVAERNIRALRDEIVDLGPYAFRELTFDTAVENCIPAWKRRYGFEVMATIERVTLPADVAGALFRIVQEAVVNAGRHSQAHTVGISLRSVDSEVELRVTDDGHGFTHEERLTVEQPGHVGLASIRERAELLGGELDIETSERGTRVLVRAPLPRRAPEPGAPVRPG